MSASRPRRQYAVILPCWLPCQVDIFGFRRKLSADFPPLFGLSIPVELVLIWADKSASTDVVSWPCIVAAGGDVRDVESGPFPCTTEVGSVRRPPTAGRFCHHTLTLQPIRCMYWSMWADASLSVGVSSTTSAVGANFLES